MQTAPAYQPIQYGKFLLLDRIARGGMAELCRAKIIGSQGFEKLIAIKKILPHLADQEEFVSAFIDEARLAAFLHHRNIVQIFDFGEMAGGYFISMEYLSGKPLRNLMNCAGKSDVRLPLGMVLFIIAEICVGLDYAHNLKNFSGEPLGIVHRDIGPQNIFITYDGQVKIIDFGIARATSHNTVTTVGSLKGKIAYMSPEQASGKEIDHRSDIFSVGIILYELVTGRHLYTAEDSGQQLALAADCRFVPARELNASLPPLLYDILDKALAREPDDRYQTTGELWADLERCAKETGAFATAPELALFMAQFFKADMEHEEAALRQDVSVELPLADEVLDSEISSLEPTVLLAREEHAPEFKVQEPRLHRRIFLLVVVVLVLGMGGVAAVKFFGKLEEKASAISVVNPAQENPIALQDEARSYFTRLLTGQAQASGRSLPPKDLADFDRHASLFMEKSPREAGIVLEKLALSYPNSARVHFQLGRLYTQRKEVDKAMAAYQKAVSLDSKMDEAFFNLGFLHADKKEYKEAKAMYAKVIELGPAYVDPPSCKTV
ncbi:MAG: protein kinase [Deltaproteobacteria bacterium]|nr:protein kinase [Deltaproteobacteria bacterium]